ncbi:MAG: hypothetical protein HY695_09475 [Deltaproteobacteria bacterium]|nr:hypothetical protein [Deltaproteobacteria bacterium]
MIRKHISVVSFQELALGVRFFLRLPVFLRRPVTLTESERILRQRLENREGDFLSLARSAVYQNPASPYRRLLALAGCEFGDLEKMVRQEGLEGALHKLFQSGVYLRVEEFKDRCPVVRGSAKFEISPSQHRNPLTAFHLPVRSGGSRSEGTPIPTDLISIRDRAVDLRLAFGAQGLQGSQHALWTIPGGAAITLVLRFCLIGSPPERWFTLVDPAASELHPRYLWSARAVQWGGRLAGKPLPRWEYTPRDDPLPVARWIDRRLRAGYSPHLFTFPSAAVYLCQAALDAKIDLSGARFTIGGEPVTRARLDAISRAGVVALPWYGNAESNGPIGFGCMRPQAPDDVHFPHDLNALIQVGADGKKGGLSHNALLISSLRRTAPLVLLNVSLGDEAVMAERKCGCPLERLGWTTHLHTIRSYEKLTAGGINFLDNDVIRVLDDILPARFGGGPGDYQLVEEEQETGSPRLRLLVHPDVGAVDSDAVTRTLLESIGAGSAGERVMSLLWRDTDIVQVERRVPLASPTGKILHMHLRRRKEDA